MYSQPNKQQHKQYLREQILGASPGKLLLLMYDGAIKALDESLLHAEDQDPHDFTNLVIKAQNIISELMGSLKVDIYPELVGNLARLYEFMHQHLVKASLEKDVKKIEQVNALLRNLRASWKEALAKIDDGEAEEISEEQTRVIEKAQNRPSLSLQA